MKLLGSRAQSIASFDLVRYHGANERIFLYAFDLIELNGDDLRPDPLEGRKATLEMILAKEASGSTSTWKATPRLYFVTPANLASKALCRSVRTHLTVPDARPIGSR
jgi:ATP-dependent DNA ligase